MTWGLYGYFDILIYDDSVYKMESEGSSVVDVLEDRVGSQHELRCIALH